MRNQYKVTNTGRSYVLYDADVLSSSELTLFEVGSEYDTSSSLSPVGIGRAKVVYFSYDEKKLVLKHYYRGGLIASVVKDTYLGFDIENTRAFKEWRLLKKMQKLGLAVPEAIAAHVEKHLFFYRADLVTREIENAETLADLLIKQVIDSNVWKKIGACIKSFHQHNVYHSDLNARNILLAEDQVYLIDFDNSRIRSSSNNWKMANLSRLKRSLLKFKKNEEKFYFNENGWSSLMEGYNGF